MVCNNDYAFIYPRMLVRYIGHLKPIALKKRFDSDTQIEPPVNLVKIADSQPLIYKMFAKMQNRILNMKIIGQGH